LRFDPLVSIPSISFFAFAAAAGVAWAIHKTPYLRLTIDPA
jgi:hypothetical protein